MSRTRFLHALLIAITVAGVSLPHLIAGEAAGSVPTLIVGLIVGLACLRLALMARSRGGRAIATLGLAAAALAPLVAYLAQEAAEREPGLEAAHGEPSLLAAIVAQAPLIILALVAVRLLVAAVRTVVRALGRRPPQPTRRPRASVARVCAALLSPPVALISSNGQRAPPYGRAPYRLAPLG